MVIQGNITDVELRFLRKIAQENSKSYSTATIYKSGLNAKLSEEHRKGQTFFPQTYSQEIYGKVSVVAYSYIIQNYYKSHFNVSEFAPEIQFARYKKGDFFSWHIDNTGYKNSRILTMSINLSDENEYTGGELLVRYMGNEIALCKKPGSFIIFPSFLEHQAQTVLSGIRDCLVVWSYSSYKNLLKYKQEYEKLQKTKA